MARPRPLPRRVLDPVRGRAVYCRAGWFAGLVAARGRTGSASGDAACTGWRGASRGEPPMSFVSRNHPQQTAVRGALDEVDDRTTPDEVFLPLSQRFGGFTVDAAAAHHNARCERYWTRANDGLAQS